MMQAARSGLSATATCGRIPRPLRRRARLTCVPADGRSKAFGLSLAIASDGFFAHHVSEKSAGGPAFRMVASAIELHKGDQS
jgi:hypothetical protein